MELLAPEQIQVNQAKLEELKSITESTFRLITFSRNHLSDDLLNAYLDQTTNFRELLSIKNAQMEAESEEEAQEYAALLRTTADFITEEISLDNNFKNEVQLFQLFRLISPNAHSKHPNKYRHQMVQIGRFICPEPNRLGGLVSDLFYKMQQITHPVIRAIYFHHELVRIHPFSDGNGRTIRMAKNWMLMYELYPPIFISDALEKKEYISTLEHSFNWLKQKGTLWNPYLEAFFDQELDRLLRNAHAIHDKVLSVGNVRKG